MPDDEEGTNGGRTFVRITNEMVYAEMQSMRKEVRDYAQATADYPETKQRVRGLELKFYGILAGILAAVGIIILKGGLPL